MSCASREITEPCGGRSARWRRAAAGEEGSILPLTLGYVVLAATTLVWLGLIVTVVALAGSVLAIRAIRKPVEAEAAARPDEARPA